MNYVKIAKDIRKAALNCIAEERRGYRGYYVHRGIEIMPCDNDGRAHSGDPIFLELRNISGKKVREAFEAIISESADYDFDFSHFGICGGVDRYDSMHDRMNDYSYDPWAGSWDLEDIPRLS